MNKDIFKTGMTAIEVVAEIVRQNPKISALAFYIYEPRLNVFEMTDRPSVARLLFHDSATGRELWLKRGKITLDSINKLIVWLKKQQALGVLSKAISKRNEIFHVPMMDFAEGSSPMPAHNLARVADFLKEAGYNNGVVLFSGRSFHYYGNCLMNEREWRNFLGDCLLSGLAGPRYVGHREKDGYGVLRISACSLRPHIPKVVSVLG